MIANAFDQWDKQVNLPVVAYIVLNNLYLRVERGTTPMSVTVRNQLCVLAGKAHYHRDDPMIDYWLREFEKLPGWLDY